MYKSIQDSLGRVIQSRVRAKFEFNHESLKRKFQFNYCYMKEDHRSYTSVTVPVASSPPPGLLRVFTRHFSPGDGAFANFALPGGRAFANTWPSF